MDAPTRIDTRAARHLGHADRRSWPSGRTGPALGHRALDPIWRERVRRAATCAGLCALLGSGATASTQGLDPAWIEQAQTLATQAAHTAFGGRTPVRVEVSAGALDPRLRLAPCARTEIFLPPGHRPWGRTRIGLRCVEGATLWRVTLPLTVQVWARAWVAAQPLPSGTVLEAHHLRLAEVDWAAQAAPVLWEPQAGLGRTLSVPRAVGEPLRASDLHALRWFDAGETVKLRAVGPGFAISGSGVALSAGLEGQSVRVRTPGGRTVTGRAVGDRVVEVLL